MNRSKRTGIVVADGVTARVFRWDSEADELQLLATTTIDGNLPVKSSGKGEGVFAAAVAQVLLTHWDAGDYSRLIFVADGLVLNELAAAVPDALKKIVVAELERNMINESHASIRESLRHAQ